VAFPVYNCGKLSFKDGKPLFDPDCCCWLIPCCGPCYFPVANRAEDTPTLGNDGSQVGGPSTITGLEATFTQGGGGGILYPGVDYVQTWTQIGTSTHAISRGLISIDPNCDYFILRSRCFWTVTLSSESNYDGDLGTTGATVTYDDVRGWIVSLDGGTSLSGSVDFSTACSGVQSWDDTINYFNGPPHNVYTINNINGSFTATGGKAWPTGFVCNGHSSREGLFNTLENRLAVTTDFPVGWF